MITSMRLWLGALAVGTLSVDAASYATFALWPQHVDATLSLSVNAEGSSVVEASHGGALGTFNAKVDTESEVSLDPLIDTIEITWVHTTHSQSSTFDRFFARSSLLDGMNTVGIHLQAKLRDGSSWNTINETHHERIEGNIRGVLKSIFPSIKILPSLSKGFLAKSMCDYHVWKTSNPLEEKLEKPVSRLCFSSSFPLSSKDGVLFYSKTFPEVNAGSIVSGDSVVKRALFEMKQSLGATQHEHKFAMMKIGRGAASSATIETEYLEAWVSSLSDAKETWKTALPVGETINDVLVVTSIARTLVVDKLEHIWLQRGGKPIGRGSPPSPAEIEVPTASIAASVQTSIAGEGFHRRFAMDVKVLDPEVCGKASQNKTILVRVPVSNTAYMDLDEIRRMERFGELELLSFMKHIEIERPSPVSSQHVVGLEFIMPSTNEVHIEFPIHFRYQAPSESDLYRQASVVAPDMFLFCRDGDQSVMKNQKLSGDDDVQKYLQTWGLSSQEAPRSHNSYWLRLVTSIPLPVMDVLTPVGYLPSASLVSSMTLLFASMGAALLVWVSVGVAKEAPSPSLNVGASWKQKTD